MPSRGEKRPHVGFWLGGVNVEAGGVGPYAMRLLRSVSRASQREKVRLTAIVLHGASQEAARELEGLDIAVVELESGRRLRSKVARRIRRVGSRMSRLLASSSVDPDDSGEMLERALKQSSCDLLHCPIQIPPWFLRTTPYIVTMHDVQELHFPQYFTSEVRKFRAVNYQRSLRESRHVVVSYPHVKQDVCRYFEVSDEKVSVIPVPFAECTLRQPTTAEAAELSSRFSGSPFLLYPAQTWEHKNHLGLLKAFELLSSEHQQNVSLVLTGKQDSRFFPTLEEAVAASSVRDWIYLEGLVSEGALRWLYEHAALVTIPTKYEAGSFPLMEAMQLGAPVIASNVTSLPETIGDRRFIFDPTSPEELAALAARMLSEPELREANVANSRERMKVLSRDETGDALVELWSRLARNFRT